MLSARGVGRDRAVEEDEEGMEDKDADKGCDSKPRSGGFFSGTSSSSVITSYVFSPIGRNLLGDADVLGTTGIGDIGGWGDCVMVKMDVEQVGEDVDCGCWVLGRACEEQIGEERIC